VLRTQVVEGEITCDVDYSNVLNFDTIIYNGVVTNLIRKQ